MTRAKPEDFIYKEIHGDFGMDTQSIFPPFYAVLYSQWIREGELEFNGLRLPSSHGSSPDSCLL